MNALAFYTADDFDFYVADYIEDEEFALKEYKATEGAVLSGRALRFFSDSLGRHYVQALTKHDLKVPPNFLT